MKRLFASLIAVAVLSSPCLRAQSASREFTSAQAFTTANHPSSLGIPLPLNLMMKLTNSNTSLPKKAAPKDKNVITLQTIKPKPAPKVADLRIVNVTSSAADKRSVEDVSRSSVLYGEKTRADAARQDPHHDDILMRPIVGSQSLPHGPTRRHGFGEWP